MLNHLKKFYSVSCRPRNLSRLVVYKPRRRRDCDDTRRPVPRHAQTCNNMGRRSARKTAHAADASLAKASPCSRNLIEERTVRNDRTLEVNPPAKWKNLRFYL
jgi:hypothetical protein